MLLGRWVEFQGGQPLNSSGEPATSADLKRFVVVGGAVGAALWVIVNLVANYAPLS